MRAVQKTPTTNTFKQLALTAISALQPTVDCIDRIVCCLRYDRPTQYLFNKMACMQNWCQVCLLKKNVLNNFIHKNNIGVKWTFAVLSQQIFIYFVRFFVQYYLKYFSLLTYSITINSNTRANRNIGMYLHTTYDNSASQVLEMVIHLFSNICRVCIFYKLCQPNGIGAQIITSTRAH